MKPNDKIIKELGIADRPLIAAKTGETIMLSELLQLALEQKEREIVEEIGRKWTSRGFVDATPDGNYALRLLQQARANCDVNWSDNTAGIPSDHPLLVAMNKLNKDRAKELDKAIIKLIKTT